jgi:phosphoglycerate dehydrogenase-like enzyme
MKDRTTVLRKLSMCWLRLLRLTVQGGRYPAYVGLHVAVGLMALLVGVRFDMGVFDGALPIVSVVMVLSGLGFSLLMKQRESYYFSPDSGAAFKVVFIMVLLILVFVFDEPFIDITSGITMALIMFGGFHAVRAIDQDLQLVQLLLLKIVHRWSRNCRKITQSELSLRSDSVIVVVDTDEWYRFTEEQMNILRKALPENHVVMNSVHAVPEVYRNRIVIIFGAPNKKLLKSLTGLVWVHLPSSGFNGFDDQSLYCKEVKVTSSAGVYGVPISEYAMGLMLCMQKGLYSVPLHNRVSYGNDIVHSTGDFVGSTVLVVGTGDIGLNIASRCKALGARVIGMSRSHQSADGLALDEWHSVKDLPQVVSRVDFVVLCLPQSVSTDRMIDEKILVRMKPTAYLINVGRGNAVDQSSLERALESRRLAGAALDVTVPDPLLPFSRLFRYRSLMISMHHSSISPSNGERAFELFLGKIAEMKL